MSTANRKSYGIGRIRGIVVVGMLIGAIGCAGRQPIVERDDVAITNDVRARLAADTQASPLGVTVATTAGVVSLTGLVPTEVDRNAAERIARDTPGVRTVDNSLIFGTNPVPLVR